jgi:hypothetical protein
MAHSAVRPLRPLKDVTKLCEKAGFKTSDTATESLWYEGERQGVWGRRE